MAVYRNHLFLPFTATDLLNVGSGTDVSGLQASMYLGALLILRYAISFLRKGSLPFPRSARPSLISLGLFIAVIGLSLAMPLWIDGHIQIPSAQLGDFTTTPLHLNSHNVTGVLYIIYGYLLAYLIAVANRKPAMLRVTLKTFMAGSAFAAAWAFLELACKLSGIPYPAMIFNTGASRSAMGYKEYLVGNVFRISSVAVEPSIFAQTLLIAIALCLPFVFGRQVLFSRLKDRWLFALLLVVLFLTTSSTGYIGALLIMLLVFVLFMTRGILKLKHILVFAAGCALAALVYFTVPLAQQVLNSALFSKSVDYSSLERLMTITNAYGMFLKYPVLGIGWASITSHDLIVNILANAGALGLLSFLGATYLIFRGLYRSIQSRSKSLRVPGLMQIDFAVYIALAVTLATSVLSGFLSTFSFFWFVIGLGITCSGSKYDEKQNA